MSKKDYCLRCKTKTAYMGEHPHQTCIICGDEGTFDPSIVPPEKDSYCEIWTRQGALVWNYTGVLFEAKSEGEAMAAVAAHNLGVIEYDEVVKHLSRLYLGGPGR